MQLLLLFWVVVAVGQKLYGLFGDFAGTFPALTEEEYQSFYVYLSEDLGGLSERLYKNWSRLSPIAYSSIPAHMSLLSALLVGIKFYPKQSNYLEKVLNKVLKERPTELESLFPKNKVYSMLSTSSRTEDTSDSSVLMTMLYFSCYLKRPPMLTDAELYEAGINELSAQISQKCGLLLIPEMLFLLRSRNYYNKLSKEMKEALSYQPLASPSRGFLAHPLYTGPRVGSSSIKLKYLQMRLQEGGRISIVSSSSYDVYALNFDGQFKEWKSKRWHVASGASIAIKASAEQIIAVADGDNGELNEFLRTSVLPVLSVGTCASEFMVLIDALLRNSGRRFVWLGMVNQSEIL